MLNRAKVPIFIFCFALILRLYFILSSGTSTVYPWEDGGYYNDTANAIHGILSHFNIFVREFARGSLGKGAGILDTYGLKLPFGIFHRGIIHPIFIAIIYLFTGVNNFKAVWITQGVLDSFSCILVYFIGRRFFTERVSFFASILAALYFPFIYITTRLYQETFITFLLLSTILFFIKAIRQGSKMHFLAGSFCLFLVTTGRLAFMYWFLAVFTCLGYFLIREKNAALLRKALFGVSVGFLIPLLLWMGLIALEFGKFGRMMVGPAATNLYRYNVISNEGYATDEDRFSLGRHLKDRLKKEGFYWDEKKYAEWPPDEVLFRATWKEVARNPKAFLLLFLERARRLWLKPFKSEFSPSEPHALTHILHRFTILLALIGIPIAAFKRKTSIFLSGIIIYVTAVHGLVAASPRYNVSAMPFVFLIACFVLSCFWKSFFIQSKEKKRKIILFCISGIIIYSFSRVLTAPALLLIFNKVQPQTTFIVNILFKNFFILLVSIAIYLLLSRTLSKPKQITVAVYTFLSFAVLLNSWAASDKSWRVWDASLSGSDRRIRQEIIVPENFIDSAKEANLKIDMAQGKSPIGKLLVSVNDKRVKEYDGELTIGDEKFFFFEYEYVVGNPARMRRWFSIPVEISALKGRDTVRIELRHEDTSSDGKGLISVYGDYPISGSDKNFIGPQFAKNPFQTSIGKYFHDGDYRLNGRVKLMSEGAVSSFHDGQKWSSRDLSEKMGVQNGQYRIRLEIIDSDGKSLIF